MIILQAIRLDAHDKFQYRIEAENEPPFLTSDPEAVAARLLELGVRDPSRLIAHVHIWGVVEIALAAA